MRNLGHILQSIRKDKGLTLSQLEFFSGINKSTISRIESNDSSPTIETLLKICDALEISMIDLFDKEELPLDMLNLIYTAKKLSPKQRQKVTELLESFLSKD